MKWEGTQGSSSRGCIITWSALGGAAMALRRDWKSCSKSLTPQTSLDLGGASDMGSDLAVRSPVLLVVAPAPAVAVLLVARVRLPMVDPLPASKRRLGLVESTRRSAMGKRPNQAVLTLVLGQGQLPAMQKINVMGRRHR